MSLYLLVRTGVHRFERRWVGSVFLRQHINFDGLTVEMLDPRGLPGVSIFNRAGLEWLEPRRRLRVHQVFLSGDVFADYADSEPMRVPAMVM